MAVSDHAILSQAEIDNLIAQLAKATEKSYNEGFQAANEVIAKSEENVDYSTGYNQGLKIGYERGVSSAEKQHRYFNEMIEYKYRRN